MIDVDFGIILPKNDISLSYIEKLKIHFRYRIKRILSSK